jgi:hypothetical protein
MDNTLEMPSRESAMHFFDGWFKNGVDASLEFYKSDIIDIMCEYKDWFLKQQETRLCDNCNEVTERVQLGSFCSKCFVE